MKLSNGTQVMVHSTTGYIDGMICEILGIANYFGDGLFGNIYIIQPKDKSLIEGYSAFTCSEACLKVVEPNEVVETINNEPVYGYKIDWTESERGWGQRSDGTSLHLTLHDAEMFIVKHWDKEAITNKSGQAPDCYTRPDDPVKCKLNALYVKNIKESNARGETFWATTSNWWKGI